MKNQESLDKQLKQKLAEAEMAPPALLFGKIMDDVSSVEEIRRPLWYLAERTQRIAAAVVVLVIATVAWFSWPAVNSGSQERRQLSSVDSFWQETIESRLNDLEEEVDGVEAQEPAKIEDAVQPEVATVRLATMKTEKAEQIKTDREMEIAVARMTPLQAFILSDETPLGDVYPAPQQYALAPAASEEATVEDFDLPILRDTYSILSDRKLLAFAKNKFNEFTTKEHYVSFNLGNIEFGQTIQLSKKLNEN
jgi:hypothetical protein